MMEIFSRGLIRNTSESLGFRVQSSRKRSAEEEKTESERVKKQIENFIKAGFLPEPEILGDYFNRVPTHEIEALELPQTPNWQIRIKQALHWAFSN
jgi:hypothetical protein